MQPFAALIIAVDENNNIIRWRDVSGTLGQAVANGDDMMSRMKDRNFRDLVYLINKPPRWNEQVGAYVLNFNGRVTMASVKNFQLVDPDEQNVVVLQVCSVVWSCLNKPFRNYAADWPCFL
jgi:tubby-related protein 1